jgi:hypothetical protein
MIAPDRARQPSVGFRWPQSEKFSRAAFSFPMPEVEISALGAAMISNRVLARKNPRRAEML